MNMEVIIKENRPVEFTYLVKGVNSIEEGRKAALNCYRTHGQTNACYLYRTIPLRTTLEFGSVKITNLDQLELTLGRPQLCKFYEFLHKL